MLTISHASVYPGKACSLLVYQRLKLIIHVLGLYSAHLVVEVFEVNFQRSSWYGTWVRYSIASHVDVLRGSSRVPARLTSAEPKNTFLSPIVQKYQLEITCRLSEIQSVLLK